MQERVIRSLKKYLDLIKNQNIAIITHLGPILFEKIFMKVINFILYFEKRHRIINVVVEPSGLEPLTPCMPCRCSTS